MNLPDFPKRLTNISFKLFLGLLTWWIPAGFWVWKLKRIPVRCHKRASLVRAQIGLNENINTFGDFDNFLRYNASNHRVNWTVIDSECCGEILVEIYIFLVSFPWTRSNDSNSFQNFLVLAVCFRIRSLQEWIVQQPFALRLLHHLISWKITDDCTQEDRFFGFVQAFFFKALFKSQTWNFPNFRDCLIFLVYFFVFIAWSQRYVGESIKPAAQKIIIRNVGILADLVPFVNCGEVAFACNHDCESFEKPFVELFKVAWRILIDPFTSTCGIHSS